jgi:hypothetical protein
MAKYEEYAKKYGVGNEEGLEAEIGQAQEAQQARQTSAVENVEQGFQLPERFRGKSAEDIARSYAELEKLNSRQAQDLGAMRTLVDSLSTNPNPQAATVQEPAPAAKPITVDDLYDNPDETIQRAVESHPALKRLEAIEAKLEADRVESAMASFTSKHPDHETIGADPAFQNWVAADATRADLFNRARASMDVGAADALLSLYKAETGLSSVQGEVQRQAQLHDGMLETPGGTEPPAPATFSRQEWLRAMTRAKQGDLLAEEYIHQNSEAYRNALASGNVRD